MTFFPSEWDLTNGVSELSGVSGIRCTFYLHVCKVPVRPVRLGHKLCQRQMDRTMDLNNN